MSIFFPGQIRIRLIAAVYLGLLYLASRLSLQNGATKILTNNGSSEQRQRAIKVHVCA